MNPDLRVVKTRQLIREALLELMSERVLSKITISELCARAGINRKTFYRHYGAVGDVITEIENDILAEFASVFKSHGSSIFDVGAALREISATVESRRGFFTRLLKHNPDLFSKGKIKAALCRMFSVSLRNSGTIKDEGAIPIASEFAVSGVLSLYAVWFDGGCEGSLKDITEVAVKMILQGLSAIDRQYFEIPTLDKELRNE